MAVGFGGSLRSKMTVAFGLIVLVGCAVLSYIGQDRATRALESEAQEAMLRVARQAAETVDNRLLSRVYIVEAVANGLVVRGKVGEREATWEERLEALRQEHQRVKGLGFLEFGLADKEGNVTFVSSDNPEPKSANVADREYFRAALRGETAVSSSLISKVHNVVVFAVAAPVRDPASNEVKGVLVGGIEGSRFTGIISNVTYGQSGYALVVDGTGKLVAHKEAERVMAQENLLEQAKADPSLAAWAEVVERMTRREEGVAFCSLNGQEQVVAFAPIKTTGWSLALVAPKAEVLSRVSSLKHYLLLASILIVLLALGATFVLAGSIISPLKAAVRHLGLFAGGDFTEPVPERLLRLRDETGRVLQALERLRESIRPLIGQVREQVKALAQAAESLSTASEGIASSSGEVAKAIQQVAAGAGEQTGHLHEILGLVENITANLERVYAELGRVKSITEHTTRLAQTGKGELDGLVQSIGSVREAFSRVLERLQALKAPVSQVGEILDAINDIAEQTNLLSLNAAIEAARAGEAGRGFAVVADEVRKLAEQSRASSDRIRVLLESIAGETNQLVTTSEEVNQEVIGQLTKVEETIRAFDDILEAVGQIEPMVQATYRQVDNTVKAKEVLLDRVQSISAVAEEASASAEEISASAEEVSASTEEVSASAQEVMAVARRLTEQVDRFRV
ncbi:MAG: methyl-accepting chemotaxis protein [Moorellales bacterium]